MKITQKEREKSVYKGLKGNSVTTGERSGY